MAECIKPGCETSTTWIDAHKESAILCVPHLLLLLRSRRWDKKCACGQKIYLTTRDVCSRCSDPWIATDPVNLDKAHAIFVEAKLTAEPAKAVVHDC